MTTVKKRVPELREQIRAHRRRQRRIGFVPTMGAYHEGHRKLMRHCVRENDVTVVSLFVNPTQFDTDGDAQQYPRPFERDREVLEEESVDLLFAPGEEEMYPDGDVTGIRVNSPLVRVYEGEQRPRFFEGVTRVVAKLLNVVPADRVYFGEKDLQQLLVVRRMVRDLHFPHTVRPVPVARDENGVAYSSRNRRFTDRDRERAGEVYRIMSETRETPGDREELLERTGAKLRGAGLDTEYVDLVSYPEYTPTSPDDPTAVLILAGQVGEVRLKDNLPLHYGSIREMHRAEETGLPGGTPTATA